MQKGCMKKLTFYGPPVVQTLRDASHLDVSFFFFFFPLFILGISEQLLERKRKKFIRKTFPCVIIKLENDSRPRSYRLFRLFRPSATSFESKVSFPLTLFNPCLSSWRWWWRRRTELSWVVTGRPLFINLSLLDSSFFSFGIYSTHTHKTFCFVKERKWCHDSTIT